MIPSARLRTLLAARRLRHRRRAADHPSVRCRGLCLPQGPESPAFGAWLRQRDPDTAPESERRSIGGRLSSTAAATPGTRQSGIPGTAQFHSCTEQLKKTHLTGSRPTSRQGRPTEPGPAASARTQVISVSRATSCREAESCDAPREQASVSGASLPHANGDGRCRTAGFWTGCLDHRLRQATDFRRGHAAPGTPVRRDGCGDVPGRGPRARRASAPHQGDRGRSRVTGRPLNGDTGPAHALRAALPAPPEGN